MVKFTQEEIALQADTDVVSHVERRAAEIHAECVAEGATFFMLPAVPSEGAYANVYEYERSMALSCYSDSHKDVYGYRPRGDYSAWTLDRIVEETKSLYSQNVEEDMYMDEVQEDDGANEYDLIAESLGYDY